MPLSAAELAAALNEQRNAFKAFLVARLGNEADAEDLLQSGLLKAVRSAGELRDESRLDAWFYQLLRNAIIDFYRSRAAGRRRDDTLETLVTIVESGVALPSAWQPHLCGCLGGVVSTLKPRQAELLKRVDLDGETVQDAARALGITPNNASVTLHRGRSELRKRLEILCGECSETACLDCDCAETDKQ